MCSTSTRLAAQSVENRRRREVTGSVVEELTRERARFVAGERLAGRDAGRRLYDAVEPAPVGPRARMSPRVEEDGDESGPRETK